MVAENGITPNAKRLLWAGFMAILAAGIGFGVRGGILLDWKGEFGFTDLQLGNIAGAGLTGFCFGIFIGGVIVDRIGYGLLVLAAFAFHVLSAFVTFAAMPTQAPMVAYNYLYWGTFIFAVANGTLEAVANPLVATLFPNKRTHYLNILHASWPAGLVLGGFIGAWLGSGLGVHWKYQLGLFLIPTLIYGLMFLGQKMPRSEASEQGLSFGEMFKDIGLLGGLVACGLIALFFKDAVGPMLHSFTGNDFFQGTPFFWVSLAVGGALWALIGVITKGSFGHLLLFTLFIAHALIGAVELGTDTWAQNITGNILTPTEGKILFVFTSAIMFVLRFCADWIESRLKLSPVGILIVCSILACIGLLLTSRIETFLGALFALAIYAVGKTFFWPTMLAIAGDRFPRSGAIAMSLMGGIGMMSAGLLGSPGLGYAKDRFSAETLQEKAPAVYSDFRKEGAPSQFLIFRPVDPIDGERLSQAQKNYSDARDAILNETGQRDPKLAFEKLTTADQALVQASLEGDRKTLVADAAIPATLFLIFLGVMLYFMSIGGYRPLRLNETDGAN
jgi:MFS family permease